MTTPAAAGLQALRTHLETIAVAHGYHANIGSVGIGRAALAVGSKAALPTLTLTTSRDDPTDGGALEAGSWFQTWTRTVELEVLVLGADGWETAMDDVLDDVRKALTRYPYPLKIGSVTFSPPADGGEIASFSLPVTYSYTVNYS